MVYYAKMEIMECIQRIATWDDGILQPVYSSNFSIQW